MVAEEAAAIAPEAETLKNLMVPASEPATTVEPLRKPGKQAGSQGKERRMWRQKNIARRRARNAAVGEWTDSQRRNTMTHKTGRKAGRQAGR